MAKQNVTNQEIIDALLELGYPPDKVRSISISGAQNTTFREKVRMALGWGGVTGGRTTADVNWDRVKTFARWEPDSRADPITNLEQSLMAGGISNEDRTRVVDRAKEIARTQPAIRPSGQAFSAQEYLNAISDVLGPTLVQGVYRRSGAEGARLTLPGAQPPAAPVAPIPAGTTPRPARGPITGPSEPAAIPSPATPTVAGRAQVARGAAPGIGAPGAAPGVPVPGAPTVPSVEKLRADASPDEARQWVRQHYGFGAWMLDDPAVFDVVVRYAKGQLGDRDYQAELGRTSLFRTTNDAARKWRDLAETDPGNTASQRASRLTQVTDTARALGIALKPERARQIADDSLRHGWNETQLQQAIGYEYDYDPSLALVGVSKQLADLSREWGVPLSDKTRDSLGEKLAAGDMTIENVSQTLANQAKGLYPHLSADFDRGITYKTLIDPYLEDAAKTLDLDVNTIDPDDPKWSRALGGVNAKTGQPARLSRYDWQNVLKTDDTYGWDRTAAGRAHGASLASSLAKLFGR